MGARGFAPQPTALRLLKGNPGKRPLNEAEPKPQKLKNLQAPADMTDDAQKVWNRVVPELDRIGLVTSVDVEKLKRYCDMVTQWARARDFINANGMVYPIKRREKTGVDGNGLPILTEVVSCVVQWPQVSIYKNFSAELSRMEMAFGMDPSARARITAMSLEGADEEEDPFAVE